MQVVADLDSGLQRRVGVKSGCTKQLLETGSQSTFSSLEQRRNPERVLENNAALFPGGQGQWRGDPGGSLVQGGRPRGTRASSAEPAGARVF